MDLVIVRVSDIARRRVRVFKVVNGCQKWWCCVVVVDTRGGVATQTKNLNTCNCDDLEVPEDVVNSPSTCVKGEGGGVEVERICAIVSTVDR